MPSLAAKPVGTLDSGLPHEPNDRATGGRLGKESPGATKKLKASPTNWDSNNNPLKRKDDPSVIQPKQADGKQCRMENINYNDETASSSDLSDDWHIVDGPDPSMSLASSMSILDSSSSVESVLKPTSPSGRNQGPALKEYLDVNPLGPQQARYSRRIVQICTSIYSLLPLATLLATLTLFFLLFTRFYYVTILYLTIIFLDSKTCNQGGRRLDVVYNSRFWSYLASYFPITLRYTNNFKLDPNENYLLIYHPHGIAAFGAVTTFATNGLKFSQLFPGITARFMVHETSFKAPIMRETFAFRGDCSVNSRSIDYFLSKKLQGGQTGNLLTIVSGGLAEADLSDMETLRVVIKERRGFVKKALQHGAHLIPCIAFGENSVYTKVNHQPSTFMYKLEKKWYQLFKFKHPIYFGDGVFFSNTKGSLPYKRPITVAMGDPITVPRVPEPSQQDIDKLHDKYLSELQSLYESNKDLCTKYDRALELV